MLVLTVTGETALKLSNINLYSKLYRFVILNIIFGAPKRSSLQKLREDSQESVKQENWQRQIL
jgi:hypothetical protein